MISIPFHFATKGVLSSQFDFTPTAVQFCGTDPAELLLIRADQMAVIVPIPVVTDQSDLTLAMFTTFAGLNNKLVIKGLIYKFSFTFIMPDTIQIDIVEDFGVNLIISTLYYSTIVGVIISSSTTWSDCLNEFNFMNLFYWPVYTQINIPIKSRFTDDLEFVILL